MPLWLIAIGAAIAAFFGIKMAKDRELEQEKKEALDAHLTAINRQDEKSVMETAARLSAADLELERQRTKPAEDRAREQVERARRRRSEQRSG